MYSAEFLSRRASKSAATILFLIGLFSQTQVRLGAKIGISEAVCCLFAPFLSLRDYGAYKRDGVSMYFNLLLLWIAGALLSDFSNHSAFVQIIRGFSVPSTLFGVSVCIYHYLRRDVQNLKWLIIGIACSSVLSVFVFQRGSAGDIAAETGDLTQAAEVVMGYKLFWATMANTWLLLPVQAAYLSVPRLYILIAMPGVAFINAMSGGRSAFAVSLLAFGLVLIGGRQRESMRRVKRHLPLMLITLMGFMVAVKGMYSYAAQHGYLNEAETVKYEKQTAKGADIKSLLLSGRGDFFIGLFAAIDKPFIGHGSQAMDVHGYEEDFLQKYGTQYEQEEYHKARSKGYLRTIRAHSHVICYWMWHGVAGLLFWVYILYLVIQTIRRRMDLVPEWFGFLAIALSGFLWDYFFSPLGLRVTESALFCALLILVRIERMKKQRMIP